MEALRTTSFDRFARYSYVHEVRAALAPTRCTMLDVGDPYGTLATLFPDDDTISLDLFAHENLLAASPRATHVVASGLALPFADASFDLVASHDTLEHLPAERRLDFVAELLRVGRGPVVLVAPFADPRTAVCEALVNAYHVAHVGRTLEPLDEHIGFGLPDADQLASWLRNAGIPYHLHSDGWLQHWLAFMMLKAHYVSIGAARLDTATDAAFNELLRERDQRPPHYRRAFILRPQARDGASDEVASTTLDSESGDEVADLERLARELMTALPRGQDPSAAGSGLRSWAAHHAQDTTSPFAEVAYSLNLVFERLRPPPVAPAVPARGVDHVRRRDGVTAVIAIDGWNGQAEEALAGRWRMLEPHCDAFDEIIIWAPESAARRLGVPKDLDVLWQRTPPGAPIDRLDAVIRTARGAAVLLLDDRLDLSRDAVSRLLDGMDDRAEVRCTGFRDADAHPAVGGLVSGHDSLLVSVSALLVDRQGFIDVGGFSTGGEVSYEAAGLDLAWRLALSGWRSIAVGTCRSTVPAPSILESALTLVDLRLRYLEDRRLAASAAADLAALLAMASSVEDRAPLQELIDRLPGHESRRAFVRGIRTLPDEEVFRRTGEPVLLLPADVERARRSVADAVRAEGTAAGPGSVLVIEDDNNDRLSNIVSAIAPHVDVVVASDRIDHPVVAEGRQRTVRSTSPDDLAALARTASAVVSGLRSLRAAPAVLATAAPIVVDLAHADVATVHAADHLVLGRADLFLVESRAQREHWLGRLAGCGRLEGRDGSGRPLVHVAPLPTPAPRELSDFVIKGRDAAVPLDAALVLVDLVGSDTVFVMQLLRLLAERRDPLLAVYLLPAPGSSIAGDLADAASAAGASFPAEPVSEGVSLRILAEADAVVRLAPDSLAARLGSLRRVLAIASSGTPQFVLPPDPAAELLGSTPLAHVDLDVTSVALAAAGYALGEVGPAERREVGRDWQVAALDRSLAPVLDVVRRPWRWRPPPRADLPPAVSRPVVLSTPSWEPVPAAENGELIRLRKELQRVEASERAWRERAERLTSHRAVRAAMRIRRLLLPSG